MGTHHTEIGEAGPGEKEKDWKSKAVAKEEHRKAEESLWTLEMVLLLHRHRTGERRRTSPDRAEKYSE